MKAEEAYALSRKYTENTIAGAGAVAGKPCQIQSITDITGGHRVTFLWKDNSNVDHTSVMDVMDGKGIKAVAVNSSNHLIITYDDDTIVDAGKIDIHSAVNSVNGKTGNVNLTASDVGALPDDMYEEEIHGVNLLKNEAISKTHQGITFTVNTDGSIVLNGTSTAVATNVIGEIKATGEPYILSGVKNGAVSTYGIQVKDLTTNVWTDMYCTDGDSIINPVYGHDYQFVIYVRENKTLSNITIRPMIRKADIDDPTYRPYNPQAIQNQLNAQGVLGAKNLLQNTATSQTINGVTFTVNADGSVTANGTATTNVVVINIPISLPIGKYTFSGTNGQSGGSDSKYYARLRKVGGIQFTSSEVSPLPVESINGSEKAFSVLQDGLDIVYQICIYSAAGAISNLKFYPMLRLASDPDDTYQPYAMTNRELTENTRGLKVYTAGDTINCGISLVGHITTGTAKLELTLRGNFDKANIRNISVDTTPLLIRGIKGYLKTDNAVELNNILFSDYLKLDNFYIFPQYIDLRIGLISGGAFTNVDNNTLIDIQNMTLILS